jgi:hypothetical protein
MTDLERKLLALVATALRETSPQSAPAFQPEKDLPRLHYHLRAGLDALGLEPAVGGPAVLHIPAAPETMSIQEQDAWILGWYAGYSKAWRVPAITLTDTES